MTLNVLVIDDSAVMRSMIVRTLRMTGLPLGEVHEAANGQEGLEVVREHWVDLALVDINMPVMNGEEFIEIVREDALIRDLSIVVVSTERSETRIERIRSRDARFVHKPFTPEDLRQQVIELTDGDHEHTNAISAHEGDRYDF